MHRKMTYRNQFTEFKRERRETKTERDTFKHGSRSMERKSRLKLSESGQH